MKKQTPKPEAKQWKRKDYKEEEGRKEEEVASKEYIIVN